jgi:hypothetical protein
MFQALIVNSGRKPVNLALFVQLLLESHMKYVLPSVRLSDKSLIPLSYQNNRKL